MAKGKEEPREGDGIANRKTLDGKKVLAVEVSDAVMWEDLGDSVGVYEFDGHNLSRYDVIRLTKDNRPYLESPNSKPGEKTRLIEKVVIYRVKEQGS